MKKDNINQAWLRFTDEGSEGVWRDRWTNENKDFSSIPWRLSSEPTGFIAENCTGLTNEAEDYYWAFDIDCEQKINTVCQDIQVFFQMRGLCSGSVLDRLYRLAPSLHNSRRTFLGPSGWALGWESGEKLWMISNDRFPGVTANVTEYKYPLGSHTWVISGGDGCASESRDELLTLSACGSDQFTCDDGRCVDMGGRCDQREDCEDGSDEKECRIVHMDKSKYLKDKQPPSVGNEDMVTVDVDVDITRILLINEERNTSLNTIHKSIN